MRIGYDGRSLLTKQRTGIGRYFYGLASAIERFDAGNRYYIFFPSGGCGEMNFNNIKAVRSVVPSGLREDRFYRLWLDIYLPLRAWLYRLDIFHGPAYMLPRIRRVKKVVTVYDLAHEWCPARAPDCTAEFRRRCRESVSAADAVIAVSERTKNDVMELYGTDGAKIRVIYGGVDSRFRPLDDKKRLAAFRKRYMLPDHFILSVASLHPRKNLDGLLKGFAIFRENTKSGHCMIIAGKDYGLFDLDAGIKRAGLSSSFRFINYMDDDELLLLYNCADMFVFPSFYEGFGLPPLEAMACGVPVAASRAGSLPEVLGHAALYFNPEDPDEMSERMNEILYSRDSRDKLIMNGFERARGYSWEVAAEHTLALYRELA
jgi:glycosyltransferase involved in cell wall biosynthesis